MGESFRRVETACGEACAELNSVKHAVGKLNEDVFGGLPIIAAEK